MKRLLIALLILLVSAAATAWLLNTPGYVMLAVGKTTVELRLFDAVLFALAGLGLFYLLVRFVIRAWLLPRDLLRLRRHRQADAARNALVRGLIDLAEGRWQRAERQLRRSAEKSDTPLLNYLAAARAAQMLEAYDRRDEYLRKAIESDRRADIAVGLAQAELQLATNQYLQAQATLKHLRELAPDHTYVLKLLAKLHHRLHDWGPLLELLPALRRAKAFSETDQAALEAEALAGHMDELVQKKNLAGLEAVWKKLPRKSQEHATAVAVYARALLKVDGNEQAETLLKAALQRAWDEELVTLYGQIDFPDPARALDTAEGWLEQHARDPALLLALGQICLAAKLWGKARGYLESSLQLKARPEVYLLLGRLLERQMKEIDLARECYSKGLRLAVEGIAEPLTGRRARSMFATQNRPLTDEDLDQLISA